MFLYVGSGGDIFGGTSQSSSDHRMRVPGSSSGGGGGFGTGRLPSNTNGRILFAQTNA